LTQGLELAKTLLCRENLKRDYTQHTLQVWDKRFEFAELKRKFPSLGTKEDEELLLDKERVAKKPKVEPNRVPGFKLRARDSGDPGSPAVAVEASIRPKERFNLFKAAVERDLASQKERDHGYEDVVEVGLHAVHSSSAYLFVLECLSTPNISLSATFLQGNFFLLAPVNTITKCSRRGGRARALCPPPYNSSRQRCDRSS
jgi:hypothetical protein